MFSLIRKERLRRLFLDEGPALVVALAASEMFFKFHSFVFESVAFLAVWYLLGAATWMVKSKVAYREE